jgi:hypothetical protein
MAPLPLSRRCFHTLRLAERLHLVDKAIISNADFHRSPAAYAARNGVVASPDFGTIDIKQSQALFDGGWPNDQIKKKTLFRSVSRGGVCRCVSTKNASTTFRSLHA